MESAGEMSVPQKTSGCPALVQKISQRPVAERPPALQADEREVIADADSVSRFLGFSTLHP